MSLYQKHRPLELDDIKGNETVVNLLEKALSNIETCSHVFLLSGESGCGKTTIGRIIATRLGCVGNDFREVNTADFRGIDTVRDIIKSCAFKPLEGTCRVWLIDECHKMTGDAQNALLKILEDTPKHVYFILCTTEPQKLIATIKGRCQQFQVKPLSDEDMKNLLRKVVKKEGETLNKEVYDQIIQDSLGHPRNALQILEQVLNSDEENRLKTAKQTAELQSQAIELCRLLLGASKWPEIARVLTGLKEQEPESIRRVVLGYCQAVLLKKDTPKCGLILECFITPFYDSGFPQLTLACYQVFKG
jgi:DNA polymerase-3 subunit gamma/tau